MLPRRKKREPDEVKEARAVLRGAQAESERRTAQVTLFVKIRQWLKRLSDLRSFKTVKAGGTLHKGKKLTDIAAMTLPVPPSEPAPARPCNKAQDAQRRQERHQVEAPPTSNRASAVEYVSVSPGEWADALKEHYDDVRVDPDIRRRQKLKRILHDSRERPP